MSNLLSYCGLIDARIRASDKDLPVQDFKYEKIQFQQKNDHDKCQKSIEKIKLKD